jgi:predicted transcriptional regulator
LSISEEIMRQPHGPLTGPQLEILDSVWSKGSEGATVAEIWQDLSAKRPVARTTVLTMVGRLELRGWLVRTEGTRGHRYTAACDKARATGQVCAQFVDEMFDGSAAELMCSLLGSRPINRTEVQRLRDMLDRLAKGEKP